MRQKYVLFGAGKVGTGGVNYFGKEQIVAVIDNCRDKIGTLFEGIRVISFAEYLESYKGLQIIVCISSKRYFEAKRQLEDAGIYDYFTAPPVLWGFDLPEKFAADLADTRSGHIALYGVNPISVRIYDWLGKNKGIKCSFILTGKEKEVPGYAAAYPRKTLNDLSEADTVVVTTNEAEEHVRETVRKRFHGEIYDIYEKTASLRHTELLAFKDRHKGERCFIIGNGPSLKARDLDKIHASGEASFGSNRIYMTFRDTLWRPTYYVVSDLVAMEPYYSHVREYINDTFLVADYYYTSLSKYDQATHYTVLRRIYENDIDFSDDFVKGIASGMTVTYQMIQIACYMGFQEICLLGVDFSWGESGGDMHFYGQDIDSGETLAVRNAVNDKEEVRQAYMSAKRYADAHGIRIFNATRGGCLDVFERADFDGLFREGK